MEIDLNEINHLVSIMKERGTIHCEFCRNLLWKLEAELECASMPSKKQGCGKVYNHLSLGAYECQEGELCPECSEPPSKENQK